MNQQTENILTVLRPRLTSSLLDAPSIAWERGIKRPWRGAAMFCFVAAAILQPFASAQGAPFTAGDLVVERIGTGAAALTNAATAVFVDEYTRSPGQVAPVQTIALPTTGSTALTDSGTATSDGYLNLSADGRFLTLPGYRSNAGSADVVASPAARVVGRIDALGNINTSTQFSDGYTTNNFRSVVSPDGTRFFTSGAGTATTGGIRTLTFGATSSTPVSTTVTNTRVTEIFNGNLYFSTGSGTPGIYQVGSGGLPTTSGQGATLLVGDAAPYGFSISPDGRTVYVANDSNGATGGIRKYTSTTGATGSFTLAYTLSTATGGSTTTGARGLTVDYSSFNATTGLGALIYATTVETSANRLVSITDGGSGSLSALLATAGTNTVFRGVDFTPVPEPSTYAAGVLGAIAVLISQRRRFSGMRGRGTDRKSL